MQRAYELKFSLITPFHLFQEFHTQNKTLHFLLSSHLGRNPTFKMIMLLVKNPIETANAIVGLLFKTKNDRSTFTFLSYPLNPPLSRSYARSELQEIIPIFSFPHFVVQIWAYEPRRIKIKLLFHLLFIIFYSQVQIKPIRLTKCYSCALKLESTCLLDIGPKIVK